MPKLKKLEPLEEEDIDDAVEEEEEEEEQPVKRIVGTAKKKAMETIVVQQLPTQQLKKGVIDGRPVNIITIDEALTELLEKVGRIEKAIV